MNKARFYLNSAMVLSLLTAGPLSTSLAAQAQAVRANYQTKTVVQKVTKKQLSEDRLRVYSDFLKVWRRDTIPTLNIATDLDALDSGASSTEGNCAKDLDAEPMAKEPVHQFTLADAGKLGQSAVNLVDRDAQLKDVEKYDPAITIQRGQSVDSAVRDGYSHGLFSFSEIQFDKTHEHALLTYSFYCGQQCGNGGTVLMTKTDLGFWAISARCHQWMG
jgi:hypothetical protein